MMRKTTSNRGGTSFWHHALWLFLALRAGDAVNLVAGLWLVPRFVATDDIGAILPVTSFATVLFLPAFAFAMAVMKEAADLSGRKEYGQLKSLWRGVFVVIAVLSAISLAAAAALLPHHLEKMRISDGVAAYLVLASALLGTVAPVYTDALQSVSRFRALGIIEFAAAVSRLAVLALAMPLRALAGFFAGNAAQPLARIVASVIALRKELAIEAKRWWTRQNVRTLFSRFFLILAYLGIAMAISAFELSLVREKLPTTDSAAYFIITRLTDAMNYLTYPLLIVIFPYAARAAREGRSTGPLVWKSCAATLVAALLLGLIYSVWGDKILTLIPNSAPYAAHLCHVPMLLATTALTACQTFYTNAEVAAGRFAFLKWFLPANAIYAAALYHCANSARTISVNALLAWFLAGAVIRLSTVLYRPRS